MVQYRRLARYSEIPYQIVIVHIIIIYLDNYNNYLSAGRELSTLYHNVDGKKRKIGLEKWSKDHFLVQPRPFDAGYICISDMMAFCLI